MSKKGNKKIEDEQDPKPGEKIEDAPEFKEFTERTAQAPALRASQEDQGSESAEKSPYQSLLSFLLSDDPDASRLRRRALRFILRVGLALVDEEAHRPGPHDEPDVN